MLSTKRSKLTSSFFLSNIFWFITKLFKMIPSYIVLLVPLQQFCKKECDLLHWMYIKINIYSIQKRWITNKLLQSKNFQTRDKIFKKRIKDDYSPTHQPGFYRLWMLYNSSKIDSVKYLVEHSTAWVTMAAPWPRIAGTLGTATEWEGYWYLSTFPELTLWRLLTRAAFGTRTSEQWVV